MLKSVFLCFFLSCLMSVAGFAQQVISSIDELEKVLDTVNLKQVKELEVVRLANDFKKLSDNNQALHSSIRALQTITEGLQDEIRYRYIREQIELQRYQFFKNNQVIPEYQDIVKVSTAENGKIERITLVLMLSDDLNQINLHKKLFTLNSAFRESYPLTYAAVESGFLQFEDSTAVVGYLEIKPVHFPYLTSTGSSVQQKIRYAATLLDCIKEIDGLREFSSQNVLENYYSLERKKIPSGNLDQKIALREKFITYFKKAYYAMQSNR